MTDERIRIFLALHEALTKGKSCVLATIVESHGSTPRSAGARMLAIEGEAPIGTLGGGAAEFRAAEEMKNVFKEKRAYIAQFIMRPNEAADIGMVCGGDIMVLFQYFSGRSSLHRQAAACILERLNSSESAYLVTRLTEDEDWQYGLYTKGGESLFPGGLQVNGLPTPFSDNPLFFAEALCFIEPLKQNPRACLFGGGHVSQALAPVLAGGGFRVEVFEDREAFAEAGLFPMAEAVHLINFEDMGDAAHFGQEDYIVILTRGHLHDFAVLKQAMQTEARYIGMIGSRTKIASTKKRVLEAGFLEEDFQRVYTPVGLSIGAETPAEIAISIAAELIAVRHGIETRFS